MNNTNIKSSNLNITPFLNELKKNNVYIDDMYSQAPYTEAANMGIYCGQDTLQNGGYMFRYKYAPKTIFEAMKEKGYRTYYNDFQPQCHISSVIRGIDDIYYSVGFDLGALWNYRLKHYSNLFKDGKLNGNDYTALYEIFNDNFIGWLHFVDNIIDIDKSIELIINNDPSYDATKVKKQVEYEYQLFNNNKKKYVDEVLLEGTNHRLFSIQPFRQVEKIKDRKFYKSIKHIFKPVCKKVRKYDFKFNKKNCKGIFKGANRKLFQFIKKPNAINLKNYVKASLLSINQLFDVDLYKRINKNYDYFKNAPSLKTHIDHYIKWRKNTTDPSFCFMHVDDIHNPEVFFTYDTEDVELLKMEKEAAMDVLNNIPSDYTGSLSHDLSLRYIDGVIKYFYNEMEKNNFIENTIILICADHGFSFSGNPLRDSAVVNLYLENYNIPCIITGTGLENKKIEGLFESKDIPATLCYLADGIIPIEFSGKNVFVSKGYDKLIIEYCGGGCPDLSRRELKMAAFDKKLFVGCCLKLDEDLTFDKISELYDLEKDPKQLDNLINKYDNRQFVQEYIDLINKRKHEILVSNKSIVNEGE